MSRSAGVRYRLNDRDEITFVDAAWHRFARANDGVELADDAVVSRVLWDFVADVTTRELYERILRRVRQGVAARFKLRCDGPAHRRLLEMTIEPVGGGSVEFATHVVLVEERAPVALLERRATRSADLLRICAWCSRVEIDAGEWVEIEFATERLRLFEAHALPQLTHGMCSSCYASMTRTLQALEVRSKGAR